MRKLGREERKAERRRDAGRPAFDPEPASARLRLARLPQSLSRPGAGRVKAEAAARGQADKKAVAAAQDKFPRLEGPPPPASPFKGAARLLHNDDWLNHRAIIQFEIHLRDLLVLL